jgi:hypothetical protein
MLLVLLACNKPPGAPVVAINPPEPTTLDDLAVVLQGQASDPNGDDVSYAYAWFVDDAARTDLSGTTVSAAETTKGETWKVVVTPADARLTGEVGQASVVIANTAPEATVALDPLSPSAFEDITATATTSDEDDDEVTVSWAWTRDGVSAGLTEAILPAGTAQRGEEWTVTATPNDGEEDGEPNTVGFTVRNEPPTLDGITVTPDGAIVSDTLVATIDGYEDLDGDDVSVDITWTVDGVDVASETIAAGDTATLSGLFTKGSDVVVTAIPNDGYEDGEPITSAALTIADAGPSATGAHIDPDPVYVDSVVTCVGDGWSDADGDAEGWQTVWTVNGVAAGTDAVLAAGSYARGDTLGCTLIPDDGELVGTAVSAADVVVLNSVPVCTSTDVTIGDDGLTVDDTATVLSADFLDCIDADGDTLSWVYDWRVDGATVSDEASLAVGSYATRGQDITLVLATTDGLELGPSATSNILTVANSLPVAMGISITPSTLYTNSVATGAAGGSDADGDTVTLAYAWTIDGVAGGTATTLDGALFSKGQTVALTITPSDGTDTGTPISTSAVVQNSAPSAPTVAMYPAVPGGDDPIVCTVTAAASDADGDTLSYTFTWSVGGLPYTNATTTTFTGDTVPASATTIGQTWTCSVIASDGTAATTAGTASATVGCDMDEDGYTDTACGGDDCDDDDPDVNPGATEICDAADLDEDCDGLADDADSSLSATIYYRDADSDYYGDPSTGAPKCSLVPGWRSTGTDCDDTRSTVHPGATEVCDASDLDEDCDGLADEADSSVSGRYTLYPDADGDGYGDETATVVRDCDLLAGYVSSEHTDCDDTSAAAHPGATEVCADGVDNDCDDVSYPCGINGDFNNSSHGTPYPYTGISSSTLDIGWRMAGGDFNGDGAEDLAYEREDSSYGVRDTLAVFEGPFAEDTDYLDTDADVTLSPSVTGFTYNYSLQTAGDMDGDGDDELVSTFYGSTSATSYGHIQAGSPTLATRSMANTDSIYNGFMIGGAAGDFDGDGLPDAWLRKYLSGTTNTDYVTVYLGDPSGTWTSVAYGNTEGVLGATAHGDFDADGFADIVTTVIPPTGNQTAVVLEGAGTPTAGTFTAAADGWLSTAAFQDFYAIGDVTGDGYDDLGVTAAGNLYVFDGPPTSGLTTASAYANLTGGGSCVTPDTDGDGTPELFVGPNSGYTSHSYIYKYTTPLAAGVFGTSEASFYTSTRDSMAVGDFTDDGYEDLAFGNPYGAVDLFIVPGGEW